MTVKKTSGVNPTLCKMLDNLMKEAMTKNTEMSLTDKMKIADRVLKYEAIRLKVKDDGFGGGFNEEPPEEE
jgi:hypothetical protein